jgi:biofilm PGA synthesis N-glycosyltransferase PgaC
VVFNRNAVCYTECPEGLLELIRQRVRWQKGFIDAIINNSRYLFRNVISFNMNFFIIVDALISNSFATVVFIVNLIIISMKLAYGYELYTLSYYIITVLFNIICSFIALKLAEQTIQHLKGWQIYLMIMYDLLLFQLLRILFFFTGAIAYYFDNKHWYKVRRTSNSYRI